MGLLLPVNSNISHGQQLQCRNLTNVHSPYLRAMLRFQVFNQWYQCQIQIQLMFDECHSVTDTRNFHVILSVLTTALIYKEENCDTSGLNISPAHTS